MKTAFLFPGQGAQSVGMGKDLYAENKIYRETFDTLSKASGIDLKAACFDGEGMDKSSVVQPAIYTHSLSLLNALDETADIVAGLSLGEYTAMAAVDMLDKRRGAALVSRRGAIMDEAVPAGVGGMLSVLGLEIDAVERLIEGRTDIWAANHLSATQIVLAGKVEVIAEVEQAAAEAGAKTVSINASGPFHTPMLKTASERFKALLDEEAIGRQTAIIYSNFTGQPYDENSDVRQLLANQMCGRVRWHAITERLIEAGVKRFVEIGPGMVLSKMLKRRINDDSVTVSSVRDVKTLNRYLEAKGENG